MPDERVTRRAFIAIELPEELRRELASLRDMDEALGHELRWVRENAIHLTLMFLGDSTHEQISTLKQALDALQPGVAFELSARGIGIFGRASRPRTLWAGISGDARALEVLQAQVAEACQRLGWPAEEKPFSPHITLARGGRRLSAVSALRKLLDEYVEKPFGVVPVTSYSLYESKITREGAIYTELHRIHLKEPE